MSAGARSDVVSAPLAGIKRGLAVLFLAAAAVQTVVVALGPHGIGLCFTTSATWFAGLGLFRHSGLRSHKGLTEALCKNAFELAAIFGVVTGVLAAFSLVMFQYPPDRIFAWSESVDLAKCWMKEIEGVSTKAVLVLSCIYFLAMWRSNTRGQFATIWKASSLFRKWMKRAVLASVVVASFSFTANRASGPGARDGPIEVLDKPKAEALTAYTNLAWRIDLQLGAELKIQVVSTALAAMTASQQQAIVHEAGLVHAADAIPAPYLARPDEHQTIMQLVQWVNGYEARQKALLGALPSVVDTAVSPLRSTHVEPASVRELTLSGIRQAKRVVDQEKEQTETPQWMAGPGKEVLRKFFETGSKTERVEFLKILSDAYPLLAAIVDVALDAIKDSIFDRLHERAAELATLAARNGGSDLAERIHRAVADLAPKPPVLSEERVTTLTRDLDVRTLRTNEAQKRLDGDVERGLAAVYARLAVVVSQMEKLNLPLPKQRLPLEVLLSNGKDIASLRGAIDRLRFYRRIEADAISREPSDPRWADVLREDYRPLIDMAVKIRAERERAEAEKQRAKQERESVEREREIRERSRVEIRGR
jgi:hypothetical protein